MVEVFKTNVCERVDASMLIAEIHRTWAGYKANFDLSDCDNILRVQSTTGSIAVSGLIHLLKKFGFEAAVLPDDPPPLGLAGLAGVLFSK